MKISELQNILEGHKIRNGDIEINILNTQNWKLLNLEGCNISFTEDEDGNTKYITIWA